MKIKEIEEYVLMLKGLQDTPGALRFCDRFLEVAKGFPTADWVLSQDFADDYSCELQLCFENCQKIALDHSDLLYFEGYVASGDLVTEHAWLFNETGAVIDPTLVLHQELKERVKGYMGVKIPTKYLWHLMVDDPAWATRIQQAFVDGVWQPSGTI